MDLFLLVLKTCKRLIYYERNNNNEFKNENEYKKDNITWKKKWLNKVFNKVIIIIMVKERWWLIKYENIE